MRITDGNGINDCYGLKNWMYVKKLEFRIFNRFGEQVFSTSNPGRCWDGTYKGAIMNPAVFVYYAEILFKDGEIEIFKGDLTLVR